MSHEGPAGAAPGGYICPMHPEVRADAPGSCSRCGMALDPAEPTRTVRRVEYTCPMHPEVVRTERGACPRCGILNRRPGRK